MTTVICKGFLKFFIVCSQARHFFPKASRGDRTTNKAYYKLRISGLVAEDFLHGFAFRQLVNQFIQVTNFLH